MAQDTRSLGELKSRLVKAEEVKAADAATNGAEAKPKIDKLGRAYATGRRKNAIARVWLKRGTGKIVIEDRAEEVYFARPVLRMLIHQPFVAANREGQYDIFATIAGGGLSGAGRRAAPRLVARPHCDGAGPASGPQEGRLPDARPAVSSSARSTARPKARKSFQFSKR